jgi:hypothetical protein
LKKIIGTLIFVSILCVQVFGADTTTILPNVPTNVTVGGECKIITNTGANRVFAPSGNANDFAAFNLHPPTGVTSTPCLPPLAWSGSCSAWTSYSINNCSQSITGATPGGAIHTCATNGSYAGQGCTSAWMTGDASGNSSFSWSYSCEMTGLVTP